MTHSQCVLDFKDGRQEVEEEIRVGSQLLDDVINRVVEAAAQKSRGATVVESQEVLR